MSTVKIAAENKAQKFLDPEKLLFSVPVTSDMVVADFGCGNGYYSVAAAKIVGKKGQVYALDILEDALSQTATLAKLNSIPNITTRQCDLEKLGACQIPDTSCDFAIISSILHQLENKENVIREAYRVLKTGGKLIVVDGSRLRRLGRKRKQESTPSKQNNCLKNLVSVRPRSFPPDLFITRFFIRNNAR